MALTVAVFLGGCASFSKDGGFDAVSSIAKDRLGKEAAWVRSDKDQDSVYQRTQELLAEPLTIDRAVQLALLNNRGLQAAYAELGISEADYVQASRLPNPGFTFSRKRGGEILTIDRTFSVAFLNLLTLPFVSQIEGKIYERTKLLVANETLKVAAEARKAYINAVASQQFAIYAGQVKDATEAGSEFAQRLAAAGNFSKLDHAREQAFYAEATGALGRARRQAISDREKLIRAIGLWGTGANFTLPDRLPDLPKERPELQELEAYAMQNRLDIQAGKLQTQSVASSLGLTKATRFINVLDGGYLRNSVTNSPRETGYEISIQIPLFDWGSARVARAEAVYMLAVNQLAQTAINARSEVRESYANYQTSYDLAKHYRDEVVPLRRVITDEMTLRYNGMLSSVFELLVDTRDQVNAVNTYIETLRDYWVAEADLRTSLGGKLPTQGEVAPAASMPANGPMTAPNKQGQ
ncbi:TolC family protein [Cupriavidus sp. CV2]|uniref:TolC family protein n=1 Tax=Cupriavidus ulmosensis TaxID=3065913 RepID=UPI00296A93B8|nr:TolC family protein [Cupriavidus sp. CV2]MDW3686538.1 TolC family protein [Cupriavidus sp. CV2]